MAVALTFMELQSYQYFNVDRCESVCVCPCVTDVTSLPQRVLGNEATRFTITRTLGTSLLTVGAADTVVIFIAP